MTRTSLRGEQPPQSPPRTLAAGVKPAAKVSRARPALARPSGGLVGRDPGAAATDGRDALPASAAPLRPCCAALANVPALSASSTLTRV